MRARFWFWLVCGLLLSPIVSSAAPASVASIRPDDLVEFETQPDAVRRLIEKALALTERKLTYQFGSNSPENPGMDCSGAVQFTLNSVGMKEVPRSSFRIYQWTRERGAFVETNGAKSTDDPVFAALKPGDLLFWEGTYETARQNPPVSHVMIYLGRLKEDGRGVVFGSSDGRRFRGKRINGVSVFDWKVPGPESQSRFTGFAPIPGLVAAEPPRASAKPVEKPLVKSLKSGLDKLFKKSETYSP